MSGYEYWEDREGSPWGQEFFTAQKLTGNDYIPLIGKFMAIQWQKCGKFAAEIKTIKETKWKTTSFLCDHKHVTFPYQQ